MKKIFLASILMLITAYDAVAKETNQELFLFIQKVSEEHPAFKRFSAMERKADAQAKGMGAYFYNPELSFDGESKENDVETRTYAITQTLDITGKNFVQKRIGKQLAIAQKASITNRRSNYLASIIKGIAEYESANITIRLANEQADLMARFVEIGEQRSKAGDVGSTQLALSRLAGAQAQSVLADSTASLEIVKAKLKVLCNCEISTVPKLYHEPPVLIPVENIENIASTLPTYIEAQASDEAAKENVKLKKRNLMPDPTFSFGVGSEGQTDLVTFGLSIPIPVLNTGSPSVIEASAKYSEARAILHETKTKLLADIKHKFKVYVGHQKALSSWRKLAKPSLVDYTQALEKQWNTGELSASDYLLQVKLGIETAMTGAKIKSNTWSSWADYMALTNKLENYLTNSKEIN